MRKFIAATLTLLLLCLLIVPLAGAQGEGGQRIILEAADGQVLAGDYYPPLADDESADSPAVLLAHHSGGQKERWNDIIPDLREAGYTVLNIDLRGHGDTRGRTDWPANEDDIRLWVAWLRDQPGVDPAGVNFVGASMGGDLSLRVMATDEDIVSIIMISPGLDFNGITTADAMAEIGSRPVLIVAGMADQAAVDAVAAYLDIGGLEMMVRFYDTGACCTGLFLLERDLLPTLLFWLDLHN